MAPAGAGKRKRGERSWSGDSTNDGQRPSPHRPNSLSLAHQNQHAGHSPGRDLPDHRGRGGRKGSRGGRTGSTQNRSPVNGTSPMSPPPPTKVPASIAPESREVTATPQPVTRPATPQKKPPGPEDIAPKEPRPFAYEYVTEQTLASWETQGRATLLEIVKTAIQQSNALLISSLLQEITVSGLDGRLDPASAGDVVKQMIAMNESAHGTYAGTKDEASAGKLDVKTLFLDTLSVLTESEASTVVARTLVSETGISPEAMREELDSTLLQSLGLIRDTFARMGIRKQTNLLYRQANFNLLREESEGFAKLMTELFATSERGPATEVVEETVERVKAMIGAFDLDVGKTLDVVLDIFGSVLVKQCRFFVKFLRKSPWWPREGGVMSSHGPDSLRVGGLPHWAQPEYSLFSEKEKSEHQDLVDERDRRFWKRARQVGLKAFFELGGRLAGDGYSNGTMAEEDDTKKWIEETGTLPPQGNRDAAQLLGFKLRFYSSSSARSQSDTLPDNLIYLSALLIKIGFVSLKDLYPHLWRADEDMEVLCQQKQKEKVERELAARPGAGAKNALLMAGALADDTLPPPVPNRLREVEARSSTPSKLSEPDKTKPVGDIEDNLPEPIDQKVSLLKSLLTIGALPESLYILGRFPWILDLYPDLPEYIHRIIHHSISKVYEPLDPLKDRHSLRDQRRLTDEQAGLPKGQIKLVEAPVRKTMKWALLDKEDSSIDGVDYRFYWDDWNDNVPVCQTVDDVFTLCDTFVNLSGVRIGQDTSLLVKFVRIGKYSMATDTSESNSARWIKLCKRLLVPALSLTKANPGVINEVWDLISLFSRETRYSMYTEWSSGRTSKTPPIKVAFDLARSETKDVLKRLSKTNLKPTARTLAKIAYANPHVAINVALGQIEAYDNFAEVVTEGARYFTILGYDVLSWSLISALGRAGRSRVQEGGLLTSRWLAALALFAGKVFRRYSTISPVPILQYVAHQLRIGNSTDLIVLEQMILFMAGIVTDTNYNESQLQAMGGGPLLQSQTILQLLDKRHEPTVKASSRRLMRALRDSGLVGQLLVLIAQQRRKCVYSIDDVDAPLKLLGNLLDEIHRILVQYLDLLRSNLTLEEFTSFVPGISDLIIAYGIEPEVAFWICRPSISHQMMEYERNNPDMFDKKKPELLVKESADADVDMKDGDNDIEIEKTQMTSNGTEPEKSHSTATANGVESTTTASLKESSLSPEPPLSISKVWHPVLEDLMESIKPGVPEDVSNIIGLPFYTTFWQLSLYDLNIPGAAYEAELTRQNKQIVSNNSDRSDLKRRDERKKLLADLIDDLLAENRQHLKSFADTKGRLLREKEHWFSDMFQKHESLNIALMERCFLPRIALSPLDAFFCFKMIKFMHANGTPNFRTLGFYDLIFREARLTSLVFSCSSKEADNLGRFLNEVLRDLTRWHKDKVVYDREACGSKKQLPGFAKKVAANGKPETFLDYEDFRKILYKWHTVLHKALKNCLISTDYMHIRNAISVLKAISQHFPAVNWIGTSLQTTVSDLQKSDKEDVRVPSAALMGDLNRREKDWMIPQAFRQGDEPSVAPINKAVSPQPSSKSLDATAAEFQPAAATVANGGFTDTSATGAEDGEVDDTDMADANAQNPQGDATLSEVKVESTTNVSEEESAAITKAAETKAMEDAASIAVNDEIQRPDSSNAAGKEPQQPASRLDPSRSVNVPKRPDPTRSSSNLTPKATLPNRPDRPESRTSRPNDARLPSRPPDPLHDRRDQRADVARSDRYEDRNRDRTSHIANGLRTSERLSHDLHDNREPSYRDHPEDRLRQSSSRDTKSRDEHHGRAYPGSEAYTRRGDTRESAMAPPYVAASQAAHSAAINPERAALIGQATSDRPDSSKGGKDERGPRGSRPSSPRRNEDRTSRYGERRDHSTTDDRRYPRNEQDSRPRNDEPRLLREDFAAQVSSSRQPLVDMNYGRLNEDSRPSRRRDDALDRPTSSTSHASGPRTRNPPSGPSQDRQYSDRLPPSGPGRSQARGMSGQDHGTSSLAPQASPDVSGIHPDRLKAFQSPSSEAQSSRQERSDTRTAQNSPPGAPAGPRGAPSNAPSGPSPTTRAPPSGPQFADGGRGRGQRNALSAVNNTLQQAGQGTSIRGRGAARAASISTSAQSGPSTPVPGPRPDQFDGDSGSKPDLFPSSDRHSESKSGYPSEGSQRPLPAGRRGDLIDEEHASARGSGRHSTSSRGHSPERESGNIRREREREREREHGREDRDRRDSHRDRDRDRERAPDGHRERERDRERELRDPGVSRREERMGGAPAASQPTTAPTRRSGRRDDSISQSSPQTQPHPRGGPLPPQSFEAENARRGGTGPSSNYPPRGNTNDRSYDSRDRDIRDRPQSRSNDRDYDRDGANGRKGPPPPPPPPSGPSRDRDRDRDHPPSGPSNNNTPSSITPQKRGRPPSDDAPSANDGSSGNRGYGSGYGSGGRGPGPRNSSGAYSGSHTGGGPNSRNETRGPSESKRPRRGP